MELRQATAADAATIANLYQETIRKINSRDYDAAQVEAWAGRGTDLDRWRQKIAEQYFIVATEKEFCGFASINSVGYLDMMFVHHDHQGKGIATLLLNELERYARREEIEQIKADVSITAKPIFLKQGFTALKQQTVMIGETALSNFQMIKTG